MNDCPLPPTSDLPIPLDALKAWNEAARQVLTAWDTAPLEAHQVLAPRVCAGCDNAVEGRRGGWPRVFCSDQCRSREWGRARRPRRPFEAGRMIR